MWKSTKVFSISIISRLGNALNRLFTKKVFQVPGKVLWRNKRRAATAWMDQYAVLAGTVMDGTQGAGLGDMSQPTRIRKTLQCKSFDWYVKHIFPELFVPGGRRDFRGMTDGVTILGTGESVKDAVIHPNTNSEEFKSKNQLYAGSIRNLGLKNERACLDTLGNSHSQGADIGVYPCHGQNGSQAFVYLKKDQQIRISQADFQHCVGRKKRNSKEGRPDNDIGKITGNNGGMEEIVVVYHCEDRWEDPMQEMHTADEEVDQKDIERFASMKEKGLSSSEGDNNVVKYRHAFTDFVFLPMEELDKNSEEDGNDKTSPKFLTKADLENFLLKEEKANGEGSTSVDVFAQKGMFVYLGRYGTTSQEGQEHPLDASSANANNFLCLCSSAEKGAQSQSPLSLGLKRCDKVDTKQHWMWGKSAQ